MASGANNRIRCTLRTWHTVIASGALQAASKPRTCSIISSCTCSWSCSSRNTCGATNCKHRYDRGELWATVPNRAGTAVHQGAVATTRKCVRAILIHTSSGTIIACSARPGDIAHSNGTTIVPWNASNAGRLIGCSKRWLVGAKGTWILERLHRAVTTPIPSRAHSSLSS